MSYDIELCDPVSHETQLLDTPHQMAGGMYALGGTQEMWLNVTYNYSRWYYKPGVFSETREDSKGIRAIYGLTGAESIPVLRNAIAALESMLGEYVDDGDREACEKQGVTGYWLPTRQNAIRPLYQLLALAQMRPDGIWEGD